MMEEWRDIEGFDGFQVSNTGLVRSYWMKKRCPKGYGTYRERLDIPYIIPSSDDGNGYQKVFLYDHITNTKKCLKVHKLVAEAFLQKPDDDTIDWTIDHIESGREGKLNNHVNNLRYISRRANIQKAYADGMCDQRIRSQEKLIVCTDTWTGKEYAFNSSREASDNMGINQSTILHSLPKATLVQKRYIFERPTGRDRLLYSEEYMPCYAYDGE